MKYSIIIPTYNHCDDLLKPCIESILLYTNIQDFELIVSANGCTDNTREYLEQLKSDTPHLQIKTIWNDKPLGFARAVNEGIKLAQTNHLVLLNNDVLFLPQTQNFWINKLYEPFEQDPKVGLSSIFKDYSAPANHYAAIFFCVMIKKEVFDTLGLLNEEYELGAGEDTEFCILAERAGYTVAEILPNKEYSSVLHKMVAEFPIYHRGEGTVHDTLLVPDWNSSFLKNSIKLSKKFNPSWYQNWRSQNMKYTIIIPTYNHCDDLLRPCVESLLRYTDFSNTELIIVANGCTDNTREYFESLPIIHKHLIWRDEPIGYTKATNLGIQEARGQYVVLLNNDTEILPSSTNYWLDELHRPFVSNTKMALTGSLKLYDHDVQQHFIVFCCAMIKREIFDRIGVLDEIFSPGYGEDIDFSLRVIQHGYEWECIDETQLIDGVNVGKFPFWHKSNKTFGEISEYSNVIVQRNRQTLIERYMRNPIRYSIVIPTYNHCDDLLRPCIESIQKFTDLHNVEIIVVANGCTDNTREYVESLDNHFTLIWSDEPLGYTKATNLGISVTKGEYVILLNNDTILLNQTQNAWLNYLEEPFLQDSSTGITGPVKFSWDCGGIQREAMAFWLVMIKRNLFKKLGLLDEIYSPGMGEDGDFCIRAAEAGYKLISVPQNSTGDFNTGIVNLGFPIYHVGNGTFADDHDEKNEIIERNNKILDFRWGMQSQKHIDVSIIIPTAHNFERALKQGLSAVLQYTDLSNKEIIVVANGAPPETRQFLYQHGDRVKYIWNDEPMGVVRAYNAGIEMARGKYIVLIDDDSILLPQQVDQWINILQQPFLTEERVGASGPFAHQYDDLGFVLHSGCTMYDGQLLKKLKFDEDFNPGYFSDPDVSMRIWREGYRCVEVPQHTPDKPYNGQVFTINFPVMHLGDVQTMDKNKDIELVKRNRELLYMRHSKTTISPKLEEIYTGLSNTICDINEHFPTLRRLAGECDHIIEFGTRAVVSTYALMAGKPKRMLSYDLYPSPNIWQAATVAKENGVVFDFMERDTTQVEIEPTDLLFIDTLHTSQQLKTELKLHSDKVKKYIIMHDTETYGYIDEFTGAPGGLMPSVTQFLDENPNWKLKEHHQNNNGLTVLERINVKQKTVKYSIVIPTYNHCDDLLKPCIESIKKYTDTTNVEIIVVANGCTDNTREYVDSLGDLGKLIWVDEAIGYTRATNLGIKEACGEFVVLLNNDTELLPQSQNQWLQMLEEPLKDPGVGLTGPLELYDRYADSRVLIFFCVMIRRSLFDEIGLLDEIFAPGGGEDIDFTVRANKAGYRSQVASPTQYSREADTNVGNVPIWHKSNRTFGEIPEYSTHIVKRNGLINCKRYNTNIKLNLGAGGIEYPEYLSVDLHDPRANIHMDITKLDFEDNSVTEILASHVFEHLNPYKSIDILKDWLRVLKPGGKLIMEMPDIEQLCKRFVTASTGERYGILNAIYGSVNTTDSGDPSDITSPHLFGWWPQSMYDHLVNSGYTNIVFMDEKIPHPESNFRVEATKPGTMNISSPESVKYEWDHEYLKRRDPSSYNDIWIGNAYGVESNEINGKTIIDIGANIGMFTMKILPMNPKHVYAIEAQPTIFREELEPNLEKYTNVTLINRAAAEIDDKIVYIPNDHYLSKVGDIGEPVQTITLDKILYEYNLSDDLVLKLDCEGSEFNIIMPASRETIRKFSVIYVEFHGDVNPNPEWQKVATIEEKMREFGFVCTVNNRLFGMPAEGEWIPMEVYMQKWVRV